MPRAESGDERRDCVTLWAVQLRRASAVAESTLRVTGMTGHRPTFLPGRCWRPMRGGTRPDAGGPADGGGQRTRVCGWPRGLHGYRFAHRPPWLKAGAGCGCLSFHYPIRPCGRAGYHSLTPDPRSASSAALLGVDTRSRIYQAARVQRAAPVAVAVRIRRRYFARAVPFEPDTTFARGCCFTRSHDARR